MSKSKCVDNDDDSYYTVNRLALITGNYMCILKAKQLADSALRLSSSDDANDYTIALGLYTLAIEEFGKAVILKEECFVDDDAPQKIPKSIFTGNQAHDRKFKMGMKKLPPECKVITVGTYLPFPSGIPTRVRIGGKKGPCARVPAGEKGNFFSKYTANVNMRMSCFFVDWDETKQGWIFHMKVKKREELQRALTTFREKIVDYDIVAMIQRRQQRGG